MICTSVVPCLAIGFAKINKIISMFVLFFSGFGHFENSAFFSKNEGTNLAQKQSNRMFVVNFEKYNNQVNFFKKNAAILRKM